VHRNQVQAGADVRAARQLADDANPATGGLPRLGAALTGGRISREHADVALRAMKKIPRHLLSKTLTPTTGTGTTAAGEDGEGEGVPRCGGDLVDEFLTEQAEQFCPGDLQILARQMLAALDPDGQDTKDPHCSDRRELTTGTDSTGMLVGRFQLDPATGHQFMTAIEHFSSPDAAREEVDQDGQTLTITDRRTTAQRRADALAIIARLALGADEAGTHGGEGARIVIHTSLDDLVDTVAETDQPTPSAEAVDEAAPGSGLPAPAHRRASNLQGGRKVGTTQSESENSPHFSGPGATETNQVPPPPEPVTPVLDAPDPNGACPECTGTKGARPESPDTNSTSSDSTCPNSTATNSTGRDSIGRDTTRPNSASRDSTSRDSTDGRQRGSEGESPPHHRATSYPDVPARVPIGYPETSTGQLVPPRLLGRFVCDAVLQAVTLTYEGAVLSLGRDVRTVTPAQRRALVARDRGCVIAGCTAPAHRCQAHHVKWFRHGGATDIDNLALVCWRHHADVHAEIWDVTMRNGIPWCRPPAWIARTRPWTRNTYHLKNRDARTLGTQLRLDTDS
jgi:hypothetical protein